jgi:hypothetical protein
MFHAALDCVERPSERRAIAARAVRFILMLTAGAAALSAADAAAAG